MAITRTSDLDINNQSAIADSELGRQLGTIFSTTSSSAMNTMTNNIMKGQALTQGLGQNVGTSLAGAGVGIASNYIGQGITSALGNNYTGRALGAGVSTGLGTVGGKIAGNLITSGKIGDLFSGVGSPYGLAATVVGSALSAGNGPSKEYAGRYGSTTRTMDTVYDGLTLAVNAIPGWGQLASGLMTLNKGLSNVFGSTDGMTQTDAILGSAFMPAPIKWLNVAGAKTTSNFNNQSWQNMEKADSFMGNAFGNLGERFGDARAEAGKTYGRFSKSAYREAQNNIDFANRAWGQIMQMANQNEIQNIRAQDMSSINNQRYAQMIQGGWNPIYRGKQGMKIFNNATNHNIGMRLLSAAALIDNKQMILSAQTGTKFKTTSRGNSFTVGATVNALYASNPREEFLGEPSHHYDFTQSDEWADAHGYYPDERGHRDDRVKKPAHPSHPSRGTWNGDKFELTDFGMQNPNYTLFGLNDGGQDPQAILTYKGGIVLPEITVTPKENYIFNPYDNIILHKKVLRGSTAATLHNKSK